MMTLVTNQGTATAETGLCKNCFDTLANQRYAREIASHTDDIDPDGSFVDCSENEAITCCVCGKSGLKYPKIDRWRVVLTDENGIDSDLDADLPDYVTEQIDEIVESDNEVTWGT
ncbi:hypothetical protein LCGC14_2245740 [marine sediment metagenome]|uniref:Uncharacterized protein n=1 Tax=marine sediment metagenome TaxID=412755 RepID=A0A0F9D4B2_9ZZZZ